MEKTKNGWTIVDKDAGVLTYTYTFTEGATANAFAARLPDGTMMVISPPWRAPDAAYDDLAAFGEVAAVVANNGFHHLGQPEWKQRFPKARFFAAPETVQRIQKKNQAAPAFEPVSAIVGLLGEGVGLIEVPETKCGETWVWTKIKDGYAWYTSDTLGNIPELPKNFFVRMIFKLTGTKAGFGVFHAALKFIVKNKKKVLAQLREEMAARPPSVIVPGHGPLLAESKLAERTHGVLSAAL